MSASEKAIDRMAATFESLVDKKSYVLVSAMDRWATPTWNGLSLYIPPRDEIVVSPGYFESYRDPATKQMIPGTLHVWDLIESTPLGDRKAYDITKAIREALGIRKDKKTGKFVFERDWGAAGVGVVLDGASAEEIEEVRELGKARFKEHELGAAQMRIHAQESLNAARLKSGLPALPDTPQIQDDREVVNLLSGTKRRQLLERFDLAPVQGSQADIGRGKVIKLDAKKDGDTAAP